jgi:hypothetical protein
MRIIESSVPATVLPIKDSAAAWRKINRLPLQ